MRGNRAISFGVPTEFYRTLIGREVSLISSDIERSTQIDRLRQLYLIQIHTGRFQTKPIHDIWWQFFFYNVSQVNTHTKFNTL